MQENTPRIIIVVVFVFALLDAGRDEARDKGVSGCHMRLRMIMTFVVIFGDESVASKVRHTFLSVSSDWM